MDYEKKYKEALKRAKEKYTKCYSPALLDYIFPELKSEDVEIRRSIIRSLKICIKCIKDGYDAPSAKDFVIKEIKKQIAWLEKQESCYSFEIKKGHWYKCVCDYMLNNSDLMFKNDRLYYCRSDWRLRGEIDERNVKNIGVNGYKSFFRPATNQEIKEWLEKQGEQKSIDKFEPKFKVGDWISNDMCDAHIASIEDGMYYFDEGDGLSIVFVDEHYHLWTIEDAMDGDVLFHSDSASNGIFIFKEIIDKGFAKEVICYCDYDSEDHFCLGEHHTCCWTDAKILYPATKEQCDLLFSKIKEAGWEWDSKKKELRKGE